MLQHGGVALSQPVHIDNGTEIIQSMMARDFGRFPDRSFDGFAVTHEDVGAVIELIDEFGIQGDADADRKALTQRTCCHIDERQAGRRVSFKV